ncbi:TPA: hypothetical protein JW571_003418 [Escherichia coli]|nr:hypothetical protein [Escherichia coli]
MDQMAENTPEVEIETDASEQIPDDVELAEEVETEDGSESSGNDAEESEVAALATGLQQARQRILALETALRLHGLID